MSVKAQSLHRGRFLELLKEGRWEYVQRPNARGAVFVLAVTDAQELVLAEQYRIPVGARTLELPAGILGDDESHEDESAEHCALRELEEETGFRGRSARILVSGPVAPGLTSEILHLVQVKGLKRVHAGGGIGSENIAVHAVPLDRIDAWLRRKARQGILIEPRIYAALYLLKTQLADRRRPKRRATLRGSGSKPLPTRRRRRGTA